MNARKWLDEWMKKVSLFKNNYVLSLFLRIQALGNKLLLPSSGKIMYFCTALKLVFVC